jgi:hypothetical protein
MSFGPSNHALDHEFEWPDKVPGPIFPEQRLL